MRPLAQPVDSGARIPSLDGLRAVSIGLVIASHLVTTATLDRVGDFGLLGVRVFFVISGYLITSLLLAERDRRGTISLSGFYFRRLMRIFPAYYVFLLVVLGLSLAGAVALRPYDLAHAFTYTTNYHHDRSWTVNHGWSLAVEEQFYLLWPLVLLVVGGTARRAAIAAAVMFLVPPLVRVAIWKGAPAYADGIGESFPTIADAIAAGCLLATTRDRLVVMAPYQRFLRSWLFWLVPPAVLVVNRAIHDHPLVDDLVGQTIVNLLIAVMVDRLVHVRAGADRVLNHGALVTVGVLSYSLYLWQQPFTDRRYDSPVTRFPLNVICAFACAALSYRLIERPFLAWRARITEKRKREDASRRPPVSVTQ